MSSTSPSARVPRSRLRPHLVCDSDIPHGTTRGYRSYGCTCGLCRTAARDYERSRRAGVRHGRQRRVPALGTQRRILSLGAVGWSQREIARRTGMTHRTVGRIAQGHVLWVTDLTAAAVRRAFDSMAALPPPWDPKVVPAAVARGGVPPLWWDDEDLDDPYGSPSYVLEKDEPMSLEMVKWMASVGYSLSQIASDAGVEPASILQRLRRRGMSDLANRLYNADPTNAERVRTSRHRRPTTRAEREAVAS